MGSSLCQLEPRPEWTKGEIELKIESPTPRIFFVTHTFHSGSSALTAGQRHSRLSGTHESRLSGTQHHSPSRSGTQRHCSVAGDPERAAHPHRTLAHPQSPQETHPETLGK